MKNDSYATRALIAGMGDTIASLATFPAYSAVGVIKISGPRALQVIGKIFMPKNKKNIRTVRNFTLHYGWIVDQRKNRLDEVLVSVMRKPSSYTRENVVEIYSHGGPVVQNELIQSIIRQGIRQAYPGEFTFRAFMNGRIDLSQAEAVQDIVEAPTLGSLRAGVRQLDGAVTEKVSGWLEAIRNVRSRVEASISFPEEDTRSDAVSARKTIKSLLRDLGSILEHQQETIYLREGIKCVLCGEPNVGKSSLFNAFMREERVIVSPVAGTTRDVIEEQIYLKGMMVRLFDTAGLLETRHTIHRKAVQQSEEMIAKADIILFMVDASKALSGYEKTFLQNMREQRKRVLVAVNKTDLPCRYSETALKQWRFPIVKMSVARQKGIEQLKQRLVALIRQSLPAQGAEAGYFNRRHIDVLKNIAQVAAEADTYLKHDKLDIANVRLQDIERQLESILGKNVSEDVLERIFANFCIGK